MTAKTRSNYAIPMCIRRSRCLNKRRCARCLKFSEYEDLTSNLKTDNANLAIKSGIDMLLKEVGGRINVDATLEGLKASKCKHKRVFYTRDPGRVHWQINRCFDCGAERGVSDLELATYGVFAWWGKKWSSPKHLATT